MKFPLFISSIGGVGFFPVAPGTFGSIVSFVGFLLFFKLNFSLYFLEIFLSLIFTIGWIASHYALKENNFKNLDPSFIVIDECAGVWLGGIILAYFYPFNWFLYTIYFLLFRFFDIYKIGPIKWADTYFKRNNNTAAFGVMADDLLAGLVAALVCGTFANLIDLKIWSDN